MKTLVLILVMAMVMFMGCTIGETQITNRSLTLTWTWTGDDGLVGTASGIEFRYANDSATAVNWTGATVLGTLVNTAAKPSGIADTVNYSKPFVSGVKYYFVCKVYDLAMNYSPVSNVTSRVWNDIIAPAPVGDLKAK